MATLEDLNNLRRQADDFDREAEDLERACGQLQRVASGAEPMGEPPRVVARSPYEMRRGEPLVNQALQETFEAHTSALCGLTVFRLSAHAEQLRYQARVLREQIDAALGRS